MASRSVAGRTDRPPGVAAAPVAVEWPHVALLLADLLLVALATWLVYHLGAQRGRAGSRAPNSRASWAILA